MKKQLWRFKQLADQTFLKGEKTEDLNYGELQIADQKVENLRNAVTAIVKRIPKSPQGNDVDKRAKKSVEYHLSTIFQEVCHRKGEATEECQLLHYMLEEFCSTEYKLAKEYTDHEVKIEDLVIEPLQKLIDNEFPSILKIKRGLSKYLLDLDSAFNRYQSTKKETVKDDVEEAHNKVEQTRDTLAIEMFGLLARENELSSYVLQLMKLQRSYHESALKELEEVIPILEKKIGDSEVKRVFGVPLHEHLRVRKKRLALPLELCITKMLKHGMSEEGLLRITGSSSRVKRFKAAIDSGCLIQMIPEYTDVHMLASTLKSYLRELPEPLLTAHLYKEWINIGMVCKQFSDQQKVEVAKKVIAKLPKENRENLAYLVQFLAELPRHPLIKMNASNIAIVMGPNLLWDNSDANVNMEHCTTVTLMVELLIKEVDVLFPEDVRKYVSLPKSLLQDFDTESMSKSTVQFSKETEHGSDINVSSENIHIIDSPRPNSRKKKTVAPVPPTNPSKTDEDISNERVSISTSYPSYPSGSSTLNRPQKSKESKVKTSTGTNTGDDFLTPSRRKSLTHEDTHKNSEVPKSANLVSLDTKTVDHKYVTQPAVSTQVSKATPVQPVTAQSANCDKIIRTTATHQMYPPEDHRPMKPVALPRCSIVQDGEKHVSVSRTSSMRSDIMSKSANEILDGVQLRKSEPAERAAKPEVPARPASLLHKRSSIDSQLDPTLHKTSVYSVAHKQQPSIVNLQNRTEKNQPGHDNNMAEKEKFLGHQPEKAIPMPRASLENKFGDINSNCSNNKPPKVGMRPNERLNKSNERLNVSKSNEKLNENSEKLNENGNQKPSHVRTRSDGNLVDLRDGNVTPITPHTPLSPRGLSKPTQPPPPPPVNVNKIKKDSDSTDL